MTLLRAMDPKYRHCNAELLARVLRDHDREGRRRSQRTRRSRASWRSTTSSTRPASDKAGEIILEVGHTITKTVGQEIDRQASKAGRGRGDGGSEEPLILNSHRSKTRLPATKKRCSRIYQRLRPGNPPQLEKAMRAVPGEVLRRRIATAWAGSAASASTASSPGACPRTR